MSVCKENFKAYWGQKLVNTLRALHEVKYNQGVNNDDADQYGDSLDDNEEFDSFDFE